MVQSKGGGWEYGFQPYVSDLELTSKSLIWKQFVN